MMQNTPGDRKMTRFWTALTLLVLIVAVRASSSLGEEAAADIRRLIGQLDADDFETRETASRQLWQIGPSALPFLEDATRQSSVEARYRAASLAQSIRSNSIRVEIDSFCAQPDEAMNVEGGMLLISKILDPQVRKNDVLQQLDQIAQDVRKKLGKDITPRAADPQKVVAAIRQVLFEDLGFVGNEQDYYNPDNSSLPRVLATRKGLPILLGHITIAVARRLDVPIVGVPVSGPYLVKYDGSKAPPGFPKKDIYFHPYEGGRILARDERARSYPSHDPDEMVPPDTPRETLRRMLNNLQTALGQRSGRGEPLRQVLEFQSRLLPPRESEEQPVLP